MITAAAQQQTTPYRPELAMFERGDIDPELFDHAAHVYVGWRYLAECELLDGINRFARALRRLTRQFGVSGKYHETVTWFFMLVIAERRHGGASTDWNAFETENADLLNDAGTLLRRHYSRDRLALPLAREMFLLPDQGSAATI